MQETENKEEYGRHPSKELNDIFASQPFPHQGQEPERAKVVIIGIDANYSSEIGKYSEFMDIIKDYHKDGVQFWEEKGVHHPFLLESYPPSLDKRTGGVPYHRKFTWLGLDITFAPYISFIELLPFPTTGQTNSAKFWSMFDMEHARRIDTLVQSGEKRIILLSKSLYTNYMKKAKQSGIFQWLPSRFGLGLMQEFGETLFYGIPHFSSACEKSELEKHGKEIKKFYSPPPTDKSPSQPAN